MDVFYNEFCKEKECWLYPTRVRVESIENPSDLIKKQKLIVEANCRQRCSYTQQEFQEWLKTKQPSYLARRLFDSSPI